MTHPIEHPHDHHHEENTFYAGTHRLHAPHREMEVKALKDFIASKVPGFNTANILVEESTGDHPDKPLKDTDIVPIREFPHFYDQPPANFGA